MSAPIHDEDWDDEPARTSAPAEFARALGNQIAGAFSGESTSARLRRVEQERDEIKQAFAASQADLTRALADGDRIAARLMDATVARDQAREMWETARMSHELTLAELVSARTELELLRKNEEIRARVIRELRAELADRKGAE